MLDDLLARERLAEILRLAGEVPGDFAKVADDLESLNGSLREQIINNDGSRGGVLEDVFSGVDLIENSEAGRTFNAFHELLLDRVLADRFDRAVEALLERPFTLDLCRRRGRLPAPVPDVLQRESRPGAPQPHRLLPQPPPFRRDPGVPRAQAAGRGAVPRRAGGPARALKRAPHHRSSAGTWTSPRCPDLVDRDAGRCTTRPTCAHRRRRGPRGGARAGPGAAQGAWCASPRSTSPSWQQIAETLAAPGRDRRRRAGAPPRVTGPGLDRRPAAGRAAGQPGHRP